MGVVLYKRGKEHVIDGHHVDLKVVRTELFNGTPEKGWFISPKRAYIDEIRAETEKKALSIAEANQARIDAEFKELEDVIEEVKEDGLQEEIKTEEQAEAKTEKKVLDFKKMSNQKIRDLAKKANIEDWEKARIQTLKDKLRA